MMFTKDDEFFYPSSIPSPFRKNGQQIYCLKTVESAKAWQITKPFTSFPRGRQKYVDCKDHCTKNEVFH